MSRTEQVEQLTNYMAHFVAHIGKKLPDDIIAKLDELAEKGRQPIIKSNLLDHEAQSGSGSKIKPSFLSGYRCPSVLGKVRNQIPTDR